MAINSKRKGSVGELEVVNYLKDKGIQARRTAQYCGKTGDASDIVIEDNHPLKDWHIEVKFTKNPSPAYSTWFKWLNQVTRDANGKKWVIFHRANNRGIGAVYSCFGQGLQIDVSHEIEDFYQVITIAKEKVRIWDRITQTPSNFYPIQCFMVDDTVLGYQHIDDFLRVL